MEGQGLHLLCVGHRQTVTASSKPDHTQTFNRSAATPFCYLPASLLSPNQSQYWRVAPKLRWTNSKPSYHKRHERWGLQQPRNRRLTCRTVGNRLTVPAPHPPTARHSPQLCCHFTGHFLTSVAWQRKLCAHISLDVAQIEVCSVPFSNSPSIDPGLKDAAPKRAFPLLNAAPGETDQLWEAAEISKERLPARALKKAVELKLSLFCVARTAAPASRVGSQEQRLQEAG